MSCVCCYQLGCDGYMFLSHCRVMIKRAQGRKRFGRKNFKQRYFRLTTQDLTYSKTKGMCHSDRIVRFQVHMAVSVKMAVSWFAAPWMLSRAAITLMVEALSTSETLVNLYKITWYNIPGNVMLSELCCSLRSCFLTLRSLCVLGVSR